MRWVLGTGRPFVAACICCSENPRLKSKFSRQEIGHHACVFYYYDPSVSLRRVHVTVSIYIRYQSSCYKRIDGESGNLVGNSNLFYCEPQPAQ
jgi:hypothetical protein